MTESGAESVTDFPGRRMGFPASGVGSVATFWPRVGALIIDWSIAYAIAAIWFNASPWAISLAFFVGTALGIVLLGSSVGHLLFGMRVTRVSGQAPGIWRPLVRQLALTLVVPALIIDQDSRGGHDQLAGLVLRRFR